jgi:mRNA interferase MazF
MEADLEKIIEWFKQWTKLKIKTHLSERIIYFREKEIWWASVGANIGFEQNGKNENFERPILVFRKFGKDMLWAIPLTSKIKEGIFYFDIRHLGFKSSLILSQLKLLSSKRLIRKIGIIPANDFVNIKDAVIKLVK